MSPLNLLNVIFRTTLLIPIQQNYSCIILTLLTTQSAYCKINNKRNYLQVVIVLSLLAAKNVTMTYKWLDI